MAADVRWLRWSYSKISSTFWVRSRRVCRLPSVSHSYLKLATVAPAPAWMSVRRPVWMSKACVVATPLPCLAGELQRGVHGVGAPVERVGGGVAHLAQVAEAGVDVTDGEAGGIGDGGVDGDRDLRRAAQRVVAVLA
jgi:hypothetical protein